MSTVAGKPLVRHGKCKLRLHINSDQYSLRRVRPALKGCKLWSLTKLTGEREGTRYYLSRCGGSIACTCPDFCIRKARCKHMRALIAIGIISGRIHTPAKGGV